jgi:hypothetical protein
MNQTTEGREQETVALVIMDAYSSLVRVIPCKKRGNVLPHILDTITLWGHKPKAIRCDNAQEFINEKKFQAWRQMNQVALLRVQAHRHRMQGQIENFIRHLKGKIRRVFQIDSGQTLQKCMKRSTISWKLECQMQVKRVRRL